MPQPLLPQGSLPLLILRVLHRNGPLHGYAIAARIEQLSAGALVPEEGSLYPALHRLEESGAIKARWTVTENGRRARAYALTASGRKQLDAEHRRWRAATAAVARVLRLA